MISHQNCSARHSMTNYESRSKKPNFLNAAKPAIAACLHAAHDWRGLADSDCSA
jgi:hypothetical protein